MTSLEIFRVKRAFNARFRQKFWKKLATQSKYISLYESIESFLRRARQDKKIIALLYDKILRSKGDGASFGVSFTGFAGPEEIQLIRSGEKAGKVERGFTLAADMLSSKGAIRKAIIGSCSYPFFLLGISIAMMMMISIEIIPVFAESFPPEKWTGAAAALYSICSFINSWSGLIMAIIIGAVCVAISISLPLWTGKLRLKVDDYGPWGIYKIAVGSAWLLSVSTLMRAGVPVRQILSDITTAKDCTPYLKERVMAIYTQNKAGKDFGESLVACGMRFPSRDVVDDIRAYSSIPNLDKELFDIAKDQLEEDIQVIQTKMKRLNTVFMFLVFGEICGLLAAIAGLQSQVGV
jgi:type II secretory pathway component PulF